MGGPVHNSNPVSFHTQASEDCEDSVQIAIQDSEDGTTRTSRHVHATVLRPGGFLDVNTYHVRKYVRAVAYSTGSGRLEGT